MELMTRGELAKKTGVSPAADDHGRFSWRKHLTWSCAPFKEGRSAAAKGYRVTICVC